jgi:hypothetical protein
MDREQIIERLKKSADGLEGMINGVMFSAMADGLDPYQVLRTDGLPVLAPLISLQASCWMTLAALGGIEE